MKYAIISDIHSNYPALRAVLDEVESKVDGVICVGDIVGLYGYPKETISCLMDVCKYSVKGNHDVAVLEKKEGHVMHEGLSQYELEMTWEQTDEKHRNWVTSLSSYKEVPEEGLLISHAKPTPESSSGYTKGNAGVKKGRYTSVASLIDDTVFDFVLLGHTHSAAQLDCSRFGHDVIVLNPGSVGQPIEGPAEYGIIDTQEQTGSLHSVSYEYEKVQQKIRELNPPIIWWS